MSQLKLTMKRLIATWLLAKSMNLHGVHFLQKQNLQLLPQLVVRAKLWSLSKFPIVKIYNWVSIFLNFEFSTYVVMFSPLKRFRRKALAYFKIFAFFKQIFKFCTTKNY